jgi:hypothetical protein
MANGKDDTQAPRDTYIPKPPSKEEVDQVSREQGMISDEWAGEPPAGGGGGTGASGSGAPPEGGDKG